MRLMDQMEDVATSIAAEWLQLTDLAALDNAMTSTSHRPLWLRMLALHRINYIIDISPSAAFIRWCCARDVRLELLEIYWADATTLAALPWIRLRHVQTLALRYGGTWADAAQVDATTLTVLLHACPSLTALSCHLGIVDAVTLTALSIALALLPLDSLHTLLLLSNGCPAPIDSLVLLPPLLRQRTSLRDLSLYLFDRHCVSFASLLTALSTLQITLTGLSICMNCTCPDALLALCRRCPTLQRLLVFDLALPPAEGLQLLLAACPALQELAVDFRMLASFDVDELLHQVQSAPALLAKVHVHRLFCYQRLPALGQGRPVLSTAVSGSTCWGLKLCLHRDLNPSALARALSSVALVGEQQLVLHLPRLTADTVRFLATKFGPRLHCLKATATEGVDGECVDFLLHHCPDLVLRQGGSDAL